LNVALCSGTCPSRFGFGTAILTNAGVPVIL